MKSLALIFSFMLLSVAAMPTGSLAYHEAAHPTSIQTAHDSVVDYVKDFGLVSVALADEPAPAASPAPVLQVPNADVAQVLLNLATNYKTLGVLGVLMLLTLLSVQVIKSFVADDWKFKRLTVVVVSIVYSIASGLIVPGSNAASVIITVFLTGGGASALYEALKGVGVIKSSA